jgi:DNA-binding NarL/FixJ family response regulator
VFQGRKDVSPALAEQLVLDLERGTDHPLHETLSARELEVLCLLASGKTGREIAALLALSDKTISTYRARILGKMGLTTNAALSRYAIQNKLVG